MLNKTVLYSGIIIGILFSYFLRIVNNVWYIIIYTIFILYLDIYCLEPITYLVLSNYMNNNISSKNIVALKYLLVLIIPSAVCIFIKRNKIDKK